jgi:hypothetical protein
MKGTHEKVERFRPFTLNIVVEREDEAQALYAIFNYTPNANRLPNRSREIREAIRECVGGLPDYDAAFKAIRKDAGEM